MGSNVEAKSICIRKMEDMISDPVYTIFHVQRKQIANRTETDNATLFHFKNSLGKVKEWNSSTVKDFCSSLPMRFPVLEGFEQLFNELQNIVCKILNESSDSNVYSIATDEVHHYLHAILSACSEVFISCPQLFAVDEDSTEFTTCKTNAKTRVSQMNIVENTIMSFVKSSPKDLGGQHTGDDSEGSIESEESGQEESKGESGEESEEEESDTNDTVRVIDIANGGFEEKSKIGEFSTPGEKTLTTEESTSDVESGEEEGSGDESEEGSSEESSGTYGSDASSGSLSLSDFDLESGSDSEGSDDSDSDSDSDSEGSDDSDSDSDSEGSDDSDSEGSGSGSGESDSDETVRISSKVLQKLLKIKKENKNRRMRKRSL